MNKPKRNWKWAFDNSLTILNRNDLFDEMLDESYGPVKISGYEYDHSRAFKMVDETAYRCGVNDYIDSRLQDGDITELDDETLVWTHEIEALEGKEDES